MTDNVTIRLMKRESARLLSKLEKAQSLDELEIASREAAVFLEASGAVQMANFVAARVEEFMKGGTRNA